jgi:hypothetical protein
VAQVFERNPPNKRFQKHCSLLGNSDRILTLIEFDDFQNYKLLARLWSSRFFVSAKITSLEILDLHLAEFDVLDTYLIHFTKCKSTKCRFQK